MSNNKTDVMRDVTFSVIFIVYILLTLFIIPKILLFGAGGIEEVDATGTPINLTKFMFYSAPGAIAGVFLILFKIIRFITRNYVKKDIIDSVVHDPEDSPLINVPVVKNILRNFIMLWLFSHIIFLAFTYSGAVSQTAWFPRSEIPTYEMQMTKTADIGLHVYPASVSETLEYVLVVTILMFLLKLAKSKWNFDQVIYNGILYGAIPIICTLIWLVYHLARYGSSDVGIIAVLLFGWISAFITVLTRSIIPALAYHEDNNFIVRIFRLFSNDVALILFIVFEIVLVLIFLYMLINSLTKQKQKNALGVT